MPGSTPRRFSATDALLLFLAIATGWAMEGLFRWAFEFHHSTLAIRLNLFWNVEHAAGPYVLMLAIFLIIARILPPRPRLRRILREPGTVACTILLFEVFRIVTLHLIYLARHNRMLPITAHGSLVISCARAIHDAVSNSGNLIALTWLIQALAGARVPEPSWIDRSGRWIGGLLIFDAYCRGVIAGM